MSKGFFLVAAIAYGVLQMAAILMGKNADIPIVMFMLCAGIFSIMKQIEERQA